MATFIIDCPRCRAKVGVVETGSAERTGFDDDMGANRMARKLSLVFVQAVLRLWQDTLSRPTSKVGKAMSTANGRT